MSRLALSLKQPWAALLVAGRKSIEVRRWTTAYRGELLIHAARVDDERPEAWSHVGEDPGLRALTELRGGIVGVGVLVEVRDYGSRASFDADQTLHLNEPDWFEAAGLFGFRFELVRSLSFWRVPGYFKLFEVEDASTAQLMHQTGGIKGERKPKPQHGRLTPGCNTQRGQEPEAPATENSPVPGPDLRRFRRLVRGRKHPPVE